MLRPIRREAAFSSEYWPRYGAPEIVNTDQGSQFTSGEFTSTMLESGAELSNASYAPIGLSSARR